MSRSDLSYARWSIQDTLRFAAAAPIACLVARTIVVLAPMLAIEIGATSLTPSIHNHAIDYVAYGSNAYLFIMACVSSAPAIALSSLIVALLGATNSRFGFCAAALIPIAVVAWSYYCLRDVLMNSPLVLSAVTAYLSLYVGRRITAKTDPHSQSMVIYRFATYLFVVILAMTSEVWWRRYWSPGL